MKTSHMNIEIEGRKYRLEVDPEDSFLAPGLLVAYSSKLAEDFMPILLDPMGYGSRPFPPEFIAYRLIVDPLNHRLCALYEVYWRRQDCTWRELNKDHDHDYEQIQVHFSLKTGKMERIVISSVGPIKYGGHGIEVYSNIEGVRSRDVAYTTSPKEYFPWGGPRGKRNSAQIREIPITKLTFVNFRPVVLIMNCYHAFVGLKRAFIPEDGVELATAIKRLDRMLLEKWYYGHAKNRFGHDITHPFDEPYVKYFIPPEDMKSRVAFSLLLLYNRLRRIF